LNPLDFVAFPKLARLNREVCISEKIDGTNSQVFITPISKDSQDPFCLDYWYGPDASTWGIYAGSRTRWLQPGKPDNYGFAAWVKENIEELKKLGPGRHFGEWWGRGIQRNYGLSERRFSLFNAGRWVTAKVTGDGTVPVMDKPGVLEYKALPGDPPGRGTTHPGPECCHVVPTIWRGNFDLFDCRAAVEMLRSHGSFAAPGWKTPEGIVVYHEAAKQSFKVTLVGDESPKSCLTKPEPVRD
jgi:hypothetical protein